MNSFSKILVGATAVGMVLGTPLLVQANVVRPAPNFNVAEINGSLAKSFKGQPVILVMAPGPRSGAFRKQIKQLEEKYRYLAGRETVCVAAFAGEGGQIKSDIPFITAEDGASVASAYGIEPGDFGIAVIGPDGNLDLITENVITGERALSVIENTYEVQSASQKDR